MKQAWYSDIYKIVEKTIALAIPFEIVHFPSTGITSAINRYAEWAKDNIESTTKCIIIDLRAAQFTEDPKKNREEFFRILKAHFEQYLKNSIDSYSDGEDPNESIYRKLEQIIKHYLTEKKNILIVFETTTQINLEKVAEYKDFLVFLDHIRDNTQGKVNILITSTYHQFDENNPAPLPIITQYFNYFRKEWLVPSIRNDILDKSEFKKHTPKDVIRLLDISGGLIVIVKSLIRDLTLFDLKLNTIHSLEFNKEFFEKFINTRSSLDRITTQLKPEFIKTMIAIIEKNPLDEIDEDCLTYFTKTGFLDEQGQIRGQILPSYMVIFKEKILKRINNNCIKISEKLETLDTPDTIRVRGNEELININTNLVINKLSGAIIVDGISKDEYLSEKELKIFIFLHSKINTDVGREEIADVIWGANLNHDYSDWAIDKLISRIRDKINDTKPYKIIKTVRNKGFILSN